LKVLITGGTGFIGSRLALEMRRRGHEAAVYGQTNTDAERANQALLEGAGISLILGSVTEREKVFNAVRGRDWVFHLAAAQHESSVGDQHFWEVNVEGTRNMLDAASAASLRRFIHGSTIGVYGEAMDCVLDEASPSNPQNIYGVTKLEGERLVLSYSDRLPITVIRISETYGPGDRRLLKLFKAVRSPAFFTIGNGRNKHQLIFITDLVDGMLKAAEHPQALGQVFVLAGNETITTDDMIGAIAAAAGARPPRLRLPLGPFLVLAVVMEMTCAPFGVKPPLHRRRLDFFRKSFCIDTRKSRELLGFESRIGMADGAARTAQWYREERLL
jgi:nucleoside-diphosphate-sugar epimerase